LLPDSLDKSWFVKSFGNIRLYTHSLYDVIISKLARGDERDFDDIRLIFESDEIILPDLVLRYKGTMENSIVSDYRQKLLDLIEIKFRQWKFGLNKELIGEVKKWKE